MTMYGVCYLKKKKCRSSNLVHLKEDHLNLKTDYIFDMKHDWNQYSGLGLPGKS